MKLGELGEFGLIETIRRRAAGAPGVHRGIGDDAAELELPAGHHLLTSTDLLIEQIHFDLSWTSPYDLGRKAVAVNLSDIAAMGGTPRFLYLGLACPGDTGLERLQAFTDGVLDEAAAHQVALVGGDTCRSPGPWLISVTIEGSVAAGRSIGRDGARCGDLVAVSGTLGDSALALALWQLGERVPTELAVRHLRPAPRIALGRALAENGLATAMIDLSDGIAADLGHILDASGVGAEIEEARLPLSPAFRVAAPRVPHSATLPLSGGEDYELLCSVPPARLAEAEALAAGMGLPLTVIGTVSETAGLRLRGANGTLKALPPRGYDHFAGQQAGND